MTPTRRETLAASVGALAGCLGSVPRTAVECPARVGTDGARLGLAGDVMLGRSVDEHWRDPDRDPAGVWDGVADRLAALDGLVCNLECCISERGSRRPGRGYYFRAHPEWAVPALAAAGTVAASLANNHQLDFGPSALADTRSHLADAGIARAGAGPDRAAAVRPAVVDAGGLTVALIAFTDQAPTYAAGPDRPGTAFAPMDPRVPRTRRLVGRALDLAAERDPDLVVASLHWGPNWRVRPPDGQPAFARWLVDRGVDVVHGHSAHVLQGVEVYRGRPIVYDAGDFVDDYVVKPDLHNDRSALFELVVAGGRLDRLRLHPVVIDDLAVHPAGPGAARWTRERLRSLSAPFGTEFRRDGDGLFVPLSGC